MTPQASAHFKTNSATLTQPAVPSRHAPYKNNSAPGVGEKICRSMRLEAAGALCRCQHLILTKLFKACFQR